MKIRKRIEMTIGTERFLTVRVGTGKHCDFCETCVSNAPMLTVTEAAQFAQISLRSIFQLVETGHLHFRETSGLLLVCFDSLSAETKKQQSIKEQKK